MSKKSKMQHYVPRFYLKNFSANENRRSLIHCFDKTTGKSFHASLDGIAGENFFYDVDKDQNQEVEKYLSGLEALFSPPYKILTQGRSPSSLSDQEKSNMAVFVATQLLRTREARQGLQDMTRQMRDWIQNMQKSGYELSDEVKKELEALSDEKLPKSLQIETMVTEAPKLGEILYRMKWILNLNRTESPLWTSDHPVTRYNSIEMKPYGNLGLGCLGIEVHFPLSSERSLCICDPLSFISYPDVFEVTDTQNIVFLNSLQVLGSTRHIFSKDSSFALALTMLEDVPEIGDIKRRRYCVN